jgi:chromosome segregation ATPase
VSKAPANWMQDEYATGQLIARLRADLATAIETIRNWENTFGKEVAAHAETRKALEENQETLTMSRALVDQLGETLESTRAELAKVEARVKELEAARARDRGERG